MEAYKITNLKCKLTGFVWCTGADFQCRTNNVSRTLWWHFPQWSHATDV